MLLNTELAGLLPLLVLVGEENNLGADSRLDALDGHGLVLWRWAGGTIALTGGWPARFHDVDFLAWADLAQVIDLSLDETASILSFGLWVKESVEVGSDNVDDIAPSRTLGLPDRELIGGRDSSVEASSFEGLLAGGDEDCEIASRASALEDSFVADDNELNEIPLSPLGDGFHLGLSTRNTGLRDKDTKDNFDAVFSGGITNILEGVAVRAVDSDGGEALGSNLSNVIGDSALILAFTGARVWRVGHTELVAV